MDHALEHELIFPGAAEDLSLGKAVLEFREEVGGVLAKNEGDEAALAEGGEEGAEEAFPDRVVEVLGGGANGVEGGPHIRWDKA